MAELQWSKEQIAALTFRELFLIYQQFLESRWNYRAAVLSEIHNATVAVIRLHSKERPKITKPSDFNPCTAKQARGMIITDENFEKSIMELGDQLLVTLHGMS